MYEIEQASTAFTLFLMQQVQPASKSCTQALCKV